MSVEIDPPELGFRRPFSTEVTQVLRLKNTHDVPVAFKVKTTAPKQYCVRPNSGSISPGKEVEIQVLLQAMKEDPPLDAKCRDKFLVQSALLSEETSPETSGLIESTPKDQIKERKIRVTFLPADGDASSPQHGQVNGVSAQDSTPVHKSTFNQRSPSPVYGSPSTHASLSQSDVKSEGKPSALDNATASVSSAAAVTKDTLSQQLEAAKAQISQLKAQADQGLRQRKTGSTADGAKGATTTAVQTQPAEGVPVQIVAALCLLSFLLAYFFF